ncbi:hypothetical protein SKAU_G00050290 [Synaphobranchus kaupii]|uniref:Uncharacterized protein n=1 Tax=Synaphobranchus kaupii TaxID=118154 RepID=A0A9Q1G2W9_SYNKA|nr:hypothetical protein SKAU_G00050290 [Synaphobranchus kaupii]
MAAPTIQKRYRRPRAQLPTCYYEGYLEKRSPKEKTSRRLWTCLCGDILFFFNNNKDNEYAEKLQLSGFISLTDDTSRGTNLEAARFSLRMKDGEIKFTAPSLEARELWKGFIYSVVQLAVPSSLNLLPGQLHMLREVIEREREKHRPPLLPTPPNPSLYLPLLADMPSCFYSVSRTEAEMLLERHQAGGNGNFLLRPGRDGTSMAITTYQDHNGPVCRHYRVARTPDGGFSIAVETPIPCATLENVISYMVEMSSGTLRPLILEEMYDKSITFVQANDENGEKSLQCANPSPPIPPPKPGRLTNCRYSQDMDSSFDEIFYINEHDIPEDKRPMACSLTPPPPMTVKKALLPKHTSFLSSLPNDGQKNSPPDIPEEKRSRARSLTPPPTSHRHSSFLSSSPPVKKALLPRPTSFLSSSPPADIGDFRPPVPAPRFTRTNETPGKVRRTTLTSFAGGDLLTMTISEELKQKLEIRRAKQ